MPLFSRKDNKNSTKHRFGMNHLRRLFSTRRDQPAMQEQQPLMASEETINVHRDNTLASLEGRASPTTSYRSSDGWYDWIDQIHEEKKKEEEQQEPPQGSSGILRACLSPLQLDKPLPPSPPAPPVPPKDSKNNNNNKPLPPTPSPPPVPPKDPRRRYTTKPLPPLPLSYTKRPLPPTPPKPQVPPKDF